VELIPAKLSLLLRVFQKQKEGGIYYHWAGIITNCCGSKGVAGNTKPFDFGT